MKMESFLRTATKSSGDSQSLMKQAEQIWSMLDDMAENNVDSYKFDFFFLLYYLKLVQNLKFIINRKFIEKTLSEGKEAIKKSSNIEPRMCLKINILVFIFLNQIEYFINDKFH